MGTISGKGDSTMIRFPEQLFSDVRTEDVFSTALTYVDGAWEVNRVRREKGALLRVYDGKMWYYAVTTDLDQIQEELDGLLPLVDDSRVELDGTSLTLPDGAELDLGAVAKGYTGQHLARLIREVGVTSALLDLGGNIQTVGCRPDGDPWRVAVRDPEGEGYAAVLEVEDEAVVTSGGYERYFEQDGVRYWHILDPATGQPARTGLLSVTVVGPSGTVCDALSTALFVMGQERAADYWLAREDFDFLLLHEDGSVTCSEGLEGRLTLSGDWADREIEVVRR